MPNVRRNLMSVRDLMTKVRNLMSIERRGHVLTIKDGAVTIRHVNTNKILCVAYRSLCSKD